MKYPCEGCELCEDCINNRCAEWVVWFKDEWVKILKSAKKMKEEKRGTYRSY